MSAAGPGLGDRLRLAAGLFAAGTVLVYLGRPRIGVAAEVQVALGVGAIIATLIAGMILAITSKIRAPQHLFILAVGYEWVACAVIAGIEFWPAWPPTQPIRGISWVCLVLVVFPWIVPARPRTTLWVSLVGAGFGPLALYLAPLKGNSLPDLQAQAALLLPPLLCVGMAYLLSRRLSQIQAHRAGPVRMGPYELIERLSQGGMGEVWSASHERLVRPAAVKLVRPAMVSKYTGEPAAVAFRRFEREARATAALTSVHTIGVYDYGYTPEGAFYYAMELLKGVDLETLVQRHGPQDPGRVSALLLQVCDSLHEAHEAGLIHRDIKPANIYVCRMGTIDDFVKVLDFGLVASGEDAEVRLTRLTQEGLASGTPAYMAPETATQGHIDARVDIYGLGCVAYYLLTGELVFESKSPMRMLKDHVQTQPEPPSLRLGRELPAGLDALVLSCLEKHPDRRPGSARELAQHLRDLKMVAPWTPEDARAWWRAHGQP